MSVALSPSKPIGEELGEYKDLAEQYINAASVGAKTVAITFILILAGIAPGLIYIAYLNSSKNTQMAKIRSEITNIKILDGPTKRAYRATLDAFRRSGNEVQGFLSPNAKEKKDKNELTQSFSQTFLSCSTELGIQDKAKSFVEYPHLLPKIIDALKRSRVIDLSESYFKAIGEVKKLGQNHATAQNSIEGVGFIATYLAGVVHTFLENGLTPEEAIECFNLMDKFVNISDPEPFSVGTDFLMDFIEVFCKHKKEMIRDIQAAASKACPQLGIKKKLWQEIERKYLKPKATGDSSWVGWWNKLISLFEFIEG